MLRESPLRESMRVDPVASVGATGPRAARSGSSGMGWLGETGAGGYRGASYCAHAGPPSAPSAISSAAMSPVLKKIIVPPFRPKPIIAQHWHLQDRRWISKPHSVAFCCSMNFSENRYPLFGIMLQRVTVLVAGNSVGNFRALPPIP